LVTITIPTANRSDFIIRLLDYYASLGYRHWIAIGDSSNDHHFARTKEAVDRLKDKLKIIHKAYPGIFVPLCLKNLSELVTTPYAVYIGDDDFLVPDSLEEAAEFLNSHEEYTAVNGAAAMFVLESAGPYGMFKYSCDYGPRSSIEADTASGRLQRHLKDYSVALFSLQRIQAWRAMWHKAPEVKNVRFGVELLPSSVSAVQGKMKRLDRLYLIRQSHEEHYKLPDLFDWITSEDWRESYHLFKEILAGEISRLDGIGRNEAEEVVKKSFWSYLKSGISGDFDRKYESGREIKDLIKNVPAANRYLLPLWRHFRLRADNSDMSLKNLLSPSSKYHNDFIPIYKEVTKNGK